MATPHAKRAEPVRSKCAPIFGGLYLWIHSSKKNHQIERGNIYGGGGLFSGVQPYPPTRGGVALVNPNSTCFPLLMDTRFDIELPNSVW